MTKRFGDDELHDGDRVEVINLRNGTYNVGTVDRVKEATNADAYVIVTYDNGIRVRVGRGFVRRVGA